MGQTCHPSVQCGGASGLVPSHPQRQREAPPETSETTRASWKSRIFGPDIRRCVNTVSNQQPHHVIVGCRLLSHQDVQRRTLAAALATQARGSGWSGGEPHLDPPWHTHSHSHSCKLIHPRSPALTAPTHTHTYGPADRQRPTETDRDRQRQTETDRDRQRQTETDRDRQGQTGR